MYLEISKVEITYKFDITLYKDFMSMSTNLLDIPRCKIIDCGEHHSYLIFIYGSLIELMEFDSEDRLAASEIIERYLK